jgi:large subunit ribosomal protein L22
MSPDKPANPSQGPPDDAADAAAEAKEELGQEEAAEAAEEPKPKPKRTRKPKQPKAEAEKAVEDEAVAPAAEEPAADEEPVAEAVDEPEAAEEPEAEEETEAEEQPKRRRSPRRRRSAEAEEEPAEEAPKPSRRERPADGAPVIVRAQARYVRSSARKARLVCDLIRGKSVEDARAVLALSPRAAARDWSKLLESAIANAENNHELDGEDMRILTVKADEGPTLKRYRPRAMGRATRIRKRTSHLTIHLTPKG